MNATTQVRDRRRSKRVRLDTPLRYQLNCELGGHATLLDVDQGGLHISLTHRLAKGQRVMMEVDEPRRGEGIIELKGQVVWCRQDGDTYHVGIHVYHDEADVRIALCALMCAALKKQAAVADLRNRHFIYVEWKLAALDASDAAESSWVWKKRERVKHAMRNVLALGY